VDARVIGLGLRVGFKGDTGPAQGGYAAKREVCVGMVGAPNISNTLMTLWLLQSAVLGTMHVGADETCHSCALGHEF
jgi:hypothetical protein